MAKTLLLILLSCLVLPASLLAATFQSISQPKAILYDGPSALATKQFIVRELYPVELIVKPANGWAKVRDPQGGLYFIEADNLSTQRTVLVVGENVQLHDAPSASAKVLARIEQQVVLLLNAPEAVDGWLSVRTVDGQAGFVPLQTVWGF